MSSSSRSVRGFRAILLALLVLTALAGPAAFTSEPAGSAATDDGARIDPNG
jgi:hypothetical protein